LSEIRKKIFGLIKEYYSKEISLKKISGVPVAGKTFNEKELISAVDAVLDCWWTDGKFAKEFEEKLKRFLGTRNAILVNSGSSANLLALMSLTSEKLGGRQLKEGDEVITVAAGFPTTVNPIIQAGCVPVFCDVDVMTGNVDIDELKKAVSHKAKAVVLAHTLGNPFNIKEVIKLCREKDLWLIEDNCDALGSKYGGKYTGTFGDISTFSFYPAHHITMAEGGAVCTDNPQLARIVRSMRDWGRDCVCGTGQDNACGKRFGWKLGELPFGYDHKYIFSEIGYNLKNTDINAAIGLAQLEKLPEFIRARRSNYDLLAKGLKRFEDHIMIQKAEPGSEPSWFGLLITISPGANFSRKDLISFLENNRIATRMLFAGNITKQPYFKSIKYRKVSNLRNTDLVMNNSFWIGVYPGLQKNQIDYVLSKFSDFFCKIK